MSIDIPATRAMSQDAIKLVQWVEVRRKFFANIENWMSHAFSVSILQKGWIKSGQWPWSLEVLLSRWSGHASLTRADYEYINSVMPTLVYIAFANGTVTTEKVEEVMHDWCAQTNSKHISAEGRLQLALEEIKKGPMTEDANVTN